MMFRRIERPANGIECHAVLLDRFHPCPDCGGRECWGQDGRGDLVCMCGKIYPATFADDEPPAATPKRPRNRVLETWLILAAVIAATAVTASLFAP